MKKKMIPLLASTKGKPLTTQFRIKMPERIDVKTTVKKLNGHLSFDTSDARTLVITLYSGKCIATFEEIITMLLAVLRGRLSCEALGTVTYKGVKYQGSSDGLRNSSDENPVRHFGNGTLALLSGGSKTSVHELFGDDEDLDGRLKRVELSGHVLNPQQIEALSKRYNATGKNLNYLDQRLEFSLHPTVRDILVKLGPEVVVASHESTLPDWMIVDRVIHENMGHLEEAMRTALLRGLVGVSNYLTDRKQKNKYESYEEDVLLERGFMHGWSYPEKKKDIIAKVQGRHQHGPKYDELAHLVLDALRILKRMKPLEFGGYLEAPPTPTV